MRINILGLVLPLLFLACGGGGSTPSPAPPSTGTAPSFTQGPVSSSVVDGQSATFMVAVSGSPAPTITWEGSTDGATWNAINGASGTTYTFTAAVTDDGTQFRAKATSSAGTATSDPATLTVTAAAVAPAITTPPTNQSVVAGQTATFTVAATGTAPLSYQWKKEGNNIGTNSDTLTLSNAQTSDAGSYTVIVTNGAGSVTSDAVTLTVTPGIQPRIGVVGQDTGFAVAVSGTSPLNYQWKHDGQNIGLNSPSLVLPSVRPQDSGTYTVTITSASAAMSIPAAADAASDGSTYSLDVQTPSAQSVLVTGGYSGNYVTTGSVDKYDPSGNTWSSLAPMHIARTFHTSTRLSDGRVLVTGGCVGKEPVTDNAIITNTTELYDPATNAWTDAKSMELERFQHTATLLADGKVLVVGGTTLRYAELYDPTTNQWSRTELMNTIRLAHTATVLSNGKVLVAGGKDVANAEVYDPGTNAWTPTQQPMSVVRGWPSATTLYDGRILMSGGYQSENQIVNTTSEVYNPATDSWGSVSTMVETGGRCGQAAVLLPDGKVLITAGINFGSLKSSELYDPAANTWVSTGDISGFRTEATGMMLLATNTVVFGGGTGLQWTYMDLYDPASGSPWSIGTVNSSTEERHYPALVLINR